MHAFETKFVFQIMKPLKNLLEVKLLLLWFPIYNCSDCTMYVVTLFVIRSHQYHI